MICRLLSSERAKWLLVLGVVAIGAGFTARNVISYPTECMQEEMVNNFDSPIKTSRYYSISSLYSLMNSKKPLNLKKDI